jgi:trimeric autotransporter adhesin
MKTSMPTILITFALVCFALVQNAQPVSPPPDGAYSGANTAEGGSGTLFSLTTGTNNTALGSQALFSVTTGSQNTATGVQALKINTANGNTADGFQALVRNTTGTNNTATGWRALFANTTGVGNTADGDSALYRNTTGTNNTATGVAALFSNTTGYANTAVGNTALYSNDTAVNNTAIGVEALTSNTSGGANTATGAGALVDNTTGSSNTANGFNALGNPLFRDEVRGAECTDCNNTAVGANAMVSEFGGLQNNTAVGAGTLPLTNGGQNNIAIGYRAGAGAGGDYNIDIGNPGNGDGYTIRIGDVQTRAFIAGIYGTTTGNTTTLPVIVDSNGQLGTAVSSERFKKDIKPMEETSQSILALKPVSFHYKSDTTNTPQFGLVAEQVAAVNDALIVRDKNGKPYTVRYDAVNAMLLNEFLKEHRTVQEQEATIAQLKKDFRATVAQLTTRLDEQASLIQKVSAQLEASKPAPQVVNNP